MITLAQLNYANKENLYEEMRTNGWFPGNGKFETRTSLEKDTKGLR